MKKKFIVAFLLFGLLLYSTACQQKTNFETKKTTGETVIATINGKEISLSEFNERLKEYPSLAPHGVVDTEIKKGFLDNLIVRELIYQEALRRKIDKEKDIVNIIDEMKKRVIVDNFFKKEIDDNIAVSEDDIKKYYDENPEEAKFPDEVRASHILLKTRDEAETVIKKIKAGSRFDDLAKQYSIDPGNKDKGGDLGFFSRGMMVPEFETEAFNLTVGDISNIIETRFGFHIIKVMEKREGGKRTFDEARENLERALLRKNKREKFDNLVAELKSTAKININEELLGEDLETQKIPETSE